MLDEFIHANRDAIVARARRRVEPRASPKSSEVELNDSLPVFLIQLEEALRLAKASNVVDHEEIRQTARQHSRVLMQLGLTVAQVVHDYGDVCQVVTELAIEQASAISGEEFKTLNLCLDDAIAAAVSEYGSQREKSINAQGTERLGMLAHELKNLINTATLSFGSIKSGRVSVGGSTALILDRSLMSLADLIDRSMADVRLDAGLKYTELISVVEFIEEVEIGALLQAQSRGLQFSVAAIDPGLTIQGDRQILAAALANLLQNAFKFTREHGHISLTTRATAERVFFDVADECGGLPAGNAEDLFLPFEQQGADRSGIGLGLSICFKAAKANGGELHVRDIPGTGCVFTLDLARKPSLARPS